MDLVSPHAFWRLKHGFIRNQPTLATDHACEVLVVGGGISGAMIAYEISKRGHQTTLIERYDIGAGSTSASTALIQYETDMDLVDLSKRIGVESAQRAYHATTQALDDIRQMAREVSHGDLRERKSYYLASKASDVSLLESEREARSAMGLQVELIRQDEIGRRFSFTRPAALISDSLELDPYRLTHELIAAAQTRGLKIFDRTGLVSFENYEGGSLVRTERGPGIRCKHLVFAVGYEAARYLPEKLFELNSSFALISKPLSSFEGYFEKALLWETARPYLYVRSTSDGRVIIGGLDEPFLDPEKRDALVPAKALVLEKKFRELFPRIDFQPAYAWGGTFGETRDSLPYIGSLPRFGNLHFCCGFGGNGTTFSAIAARMISRAVEGATCELRELFGFDRAQDLVAR